MLQGLAILIYYMFAFNISVAVFYYLIERLTKNETVILRVATLHIFNPAMVAAILQTYAELLVLLSTLMSS